MRLQQHQDIDDWVAEAQAIQRCAGGILGAPKACSSDLAALLLIQVYEQYHLYDLGRQAIERLRSFRDNGGDYPARPTPARAATP